ncbi:PD-(D/E)XK nuclease family protein [Leptotrichia sp. oral taxon 847]|uniref:PD-(D/E)XK nuclease family protein n=1 Tax=Leptotrichia sp. oral taxon 847 TaxID=1785996 RepID=UPI00076849B8|nr:PD-(D/E)XK nuclease family protein [Leptotrichia sp. oral taxon 847]AMD95698.1 hypothetical protein AXF11_08995 [Leptotrichia sp. oral taxon 847]
MEIKYLGLGADLKEFLFCEFEKNENVLYVFENVSTFYEIKKELLQNVEFNEKIGIFHNFKLMSAYDFNESLFFTDKIFIKEEKQVIFFYNALKNNIDKKMKVKNYYDIIDVAYNYYNLFAELQEYKINVEKIEVENWQQEIFENLKEIDRSIKLQIEKKGLILPYMVRKVENISKEFVKKNKKIYFVGKVSFTPFEKEMIGELEKRGVEVKNILQLSEEDFDKKELKIKKSFSILTKEKFDKKNINIEICEYSSKFNQLLGLIKKLSDNKKNQYQIYDMQDINSETKKDYQLLNQNKIVYNLEETMKETKIYKVLDVLYKILNEVKVGKNESGKEYIFKVKELYNGFKLKEFLTTFKIEDIYSLFQKFVREDYKYLSQQMLNKYLTNESENLKVKEEIFSDFEKKVKYLREDFKNGKNGKEEKYSKIFDSVISKNRNIDEKKLQELILSKKEQIEYERNKFFELRKNINKFSQFLKELEEIFEIKDLSDYSKVLEEIFDRQKKERKNVRDKYFEALSEIAVLEEFEFDNLWDKFFDNENISAGLLKMFLKYLDKKAISLDLEEIASQEDDSKYKINEFKTLSETNKKNVVFLNFQDTFPKGKVNNYLFSQIQRKKMGLLVPEDVKLIEIFNFLNSIFGAKNVCLSYIKNLDENIDCSGILEEIKMKYDLEINDKNEKISEEEEMEFIKNYFIKNHENKKIGKFIQSKLIKDVEELKNKKITLGYYDYKHLKESEYAYYIDKKLGKVEKEKIEEVIDAKFFGTIIHSIYENIVKKNKKILEKGNFDISYEEIETEFKKGIQFYKYKIPQEYLEFYKNISFEDLKAGIKKYFFNLSSKISDKSMIKVSSEERIKEKFEKEIDSEKFGNASFNISIDLHITDENEEILVDYKTGDLKQKKIEDAFTQLDFYSIVLGEKEYKKFVVDVWDGKIISDGRKDNKKLTKDEVLEVLKKYFEVETGKKVNFYRLGEKNNNLESSNQKKYELILRWEDEDVKTR